MSGDGPESIPTSADRRSKRPVKKRALTPVSAQAATVESLFAKPDREIHIPKRPLDPNVINRLRAAAPPDIDNNVQGSSSAAGSGEFHVYKASRRREYARLRELDDAARQAREASAFVEAKREREAHDDEKTRRNREKREKAKARKAKGKKDGGGAGASPNGNRVSAAPSVAATTATAATALETGDAVETAGESPAAATPNGEEDTADAPHPLADRPMPAAEEPGLLIQDDDDDDD